MLTLFARSRQCVMESASQYPPLRFVFSCAKNQTLSQTLDEGLEACAYCQLWEQLTPFYFSPVSVQEDNFETQ